MICVRCRHDSTFKERQNRTCPQCKGKFAFEPREKDPFTDQAFERAIQRVSGDGKVRWAPEHLYYELGRRRRPRIVLRTLRSQLIAGIVGLVGLLLVIRLFGTSIAVGYLVAVGLFVAVQVSRRRVRIVNLDWGAFTGLFATWQRVHGRPEGLIVPIQQPAPPRRALEADLPDYSFDRAVICDRERTVDLLLANNFHFENNCAILSIDGYPPGPFETVRTMLKRNPRLQVFALHDASADGCRMAHRLATDPSWFAGQAPVIDVGLRPNHADRFRGLWQRASGAVVVPGDGVKESEAAWLTAYTVELAVIRPDQVLKRLFRAMNRRPAEDDDGFFLDLDLSSDGGDDGGHLVHHDHNPSHVVDDLDSFGSDASADDGGADSFG